MTCWKFYKSFDHSDLCELLLAKNVYFNRLERIVTECNNSISTSTILMKSHNLIQDMYVECISDVDKNEPKFQICDHVKYPSQKPTVVNIYNW